MKLLLVALLALIASPAAAQSWTVGNQGVDWLHGYSSYPLYPTQNAPADTYEPAEVALPADVTESDWLLSTGDMLEVLHTGDTRVLNKYVKAAAGSEASFEKKIRITCQVSTVKQKDNILGFGVAKFGHYHLGSGAVNWDENSTYTTLRTDPDSTCTGGPLNATNYMEPIMERQLSNGAIVGVRPQSQAFYYIEGTQDQANIDTYLRRGMKFILGGNPKDFNDEARRAIYSAASLVYPGTTTTPAGFAGYYCIIADGSTATVAITKDRFNGVTGYSRFLKDEDGNDPWGGNCTGTQAVPAQMVANLKAPQCWDTYNLTSPDGRGHFWYAAYLPADQVPGHEKCPKTAGGSDYSRVPQLTIKNIYNVLGFADYGSMYLSSDRMDPAMTVTSGCTNDPVTHGDSCSLDPCRKISANFCNGATLHADYTFGWRGPNVFEQMERECLGITVRGVAPTNGPAECDSSQVDRYHNLVYGPSPETKYSGGCASILACYNASPGNPLGQYMSVPGMAQTNVTIGHPHGM